MRYKKKVYTIRRKRLPGEVTKDHMDTFSLGSGEKASRLTNQIERSDNVKSPLDKGDVVENDGDKFVFPTIGNMQKARAFSTVTAQYNGHRGGIKTSRI